eukprot:1140494-Pelagomonas_calceolata.AAC.1
MSVPECLHDFAFRVACMIVSVGVLILGCPMPLWAAFVQVFKYVAARKHPALQPCARKCVHNTHTITHTHNTRQIQELGKPPPVDFDELESIKPWLLVEGLKPEEAATREETWCGAMQVINSDAFECGAAGYGVSFGVGGHLSFLLLQNLIVVLNSRCSLGCEGASMSWAHFHISHPSTHLAFGSRTWQRYA